MDIEDTGIIFYVKKYKENSFVIKVLSKKNNIIIGYVFGKNSNKNICSKVQIGNYIDFTYTKKTEEQLGCFKITLISSNYDIFFQTKQNILIINSCIFFINYLLIDNNNTILIYKTFLNLIFAIKNNNSYIINYYMDFLFALFKHLGINFNPYICCITNSKNTYYISPKTGNAVIKSIGDKYKDKIFIIPKPFKEFCDITSDIINSINIFYFFLEKFIKENNLFYIVKDFNFLKQSLITTLKKSTGII